MKRQPWLAICLLGFAAAFLQACSVGEFQVRSPHWGKDVCEHCRMTIVERRFAAVFVGPGAQIHFFDDLGCALEKKTALPELKNARLYVMNPQDGKTWLQAEKAHYSDDLKTPMAYGVGPAKNGTLTFRQAEKILLKRIRERGPLPQGHSHAPHLRHLAQKEAAH